MFKKKYRIVQNTKGDHKFYDIHCKVWWCPFWYSYPHPSFYSLDAAMEQIERIKCDDFKLKKQIVWES